MHKHKKASAKILSLLLALVMVVGLFPTTALAVYTIPEYNTYFKPDPGTARPASDDGTIAAQPYVFTDKKLFATWSDGGGLFMTNMNDSAHTSAYFKAVFTAPESNTNYGSIDFSDNKLTYTPNAAAAGKTVKFTLYASYDNSIWTPDGTPFEVKVAAQPVASKSDNADLGSLSYAIEDGEAISISSFAADSTEYTVLLPLGTLAGQSIALSGVVADTGKATISNTVETTTSYAQTSATITVTAENKTTKTYVVRFAIAQPDNAPSVSIGDTHYQNGDTIALLVGEEKTLTISHGAGASGAGSFTYQSSDMDELYLSAAFTGVYPNIIDCPKVKLTSVGSVDLVIKFYAEATTQVTGLTPTQTITLHIVARNPSYTITFHPNGGTVTPASATTGTDGKLSSLPTPTRSGYTFSGWFTAANGGTQITTGTEFAGNDTIYAQWTQNGGGSTDGSSTGSNVTVDGKTESIGKVESKGDTTTVTVDQGKLDSRVEAAKDGSSVEVSVTTTKDTAAAQIVVKSVEEMAAKDMILSVQAKGVNYELPTAAIDTKGVLAELGATDASKVPFTVTITSEKNVKLEGVTVIGTPVSFTVSATYNGKSVEIDRFDTMVGRTMSITADQAKRITTAIAVETDSTTRHVPTYVYKEGGKWYAKVSSMTNSTYALIENKSAFTDVDGKWYADAANELSARKVTDGVFSAAFDGDKAITRAEFAALLVNGLGLPKTASADFSDVAATSLSKHIATAAEYGIVNGIGNNLFDPGKTITRQEAMAMMTRAAGAVGYAGKTGELTTFSDAAQVAAWAKDAVAFNVGSGLIVGNNGKLMPQDSITRAETATVVLRLLQQAELVDVR